MNIQPTPATVATPRTDQAVALNELVGGLPGALHPRFADFARTLERELLSAQAALAQAKAELGAMNEASRALLGLTFEEAKWEFERLKNNLANAELEIEDLRASGKWPFLRSEAIRNLRAEACSLKGQVAIWQGDCERLEDEKEKLADELTRTDGRLSEAVTELARLRENLNRLVEATKPNP